MPARLFPHDDVRDGQDKLITAILHTIDRGGVLIAHAPTGLGKTAAALAPAIEKAIDKGKTVVFMTSRLTQHRLAMETVARIATRHGIAIPVVDLIGKRHLCLQPGIDALPGREFAEYCRAMREDGQCEYYERLRTGEQHSAETRAALIRIGEGPKAPEEVKTICADDTIKVCPYEITMLMARDARVIITDYSYIFNPRIREGFLRRINKELGDLILVVDEGHNLPDRIKELATERLTSTSVRRAIRELERVGETEHVHHLKRLGELMEALAADVRDERYVGKEDLLGGLARICPPDDLIEDLEAVADAVREEQRSSSCGTIGAFLRAWRGEDDGFTRILQVESGTDTADGGEDGGEGAQATLGGLAAFGTTRREHGSRRPSKRVSITYRCLDPGVLTGEVFAKAHSAVIMSGTLTPTGMYAELLGIGDAGSITLRSPFPKRNRLILIVPKTTTKFTARGARMYEAIADECAGAIESVPGNCAIFFPSYQVLGEIRPLMERRVHRTIFAEHPSFTKEEREELLERFKGYRATGAVLLGVMGGSFSEGIDLPGDALRAVIVVGLPLGKPDLETKALIEHFDRKFGKGWDYGYTFPAINKTLQAAGRCIRTETDRGIIMLLDERYAWRQYTACLPTDWDATVTTGHRGLIREFFSEEWDGRT